MKLKLNKTTATIHLMIIIVLVTIDIFVRVPTIYALLIPLLVPHIVFAEDLKTKIDDKVGE